jgi:hypothetical protein
MSESRVRENRTHGSMRRREVTPDQSAQAARAPGTPPADPTSQQRRVGPWHDRFRTESTRATGPNRRDPFATVAIARAPGIGHAESLEQGRRAPAGPVPKFAKTRVPEATGAEQGRMRETSSR